jgi:type IX secretion system PorP/SprF family membrane protein
MKTKFLMITFLLLNAFANAQQIFNIENYLQAPFLYNPAAAGAEKNASVGAVYNKMWTGIAGGPQTTLAYGDKYFENKKLGVAFVGYSDKTGPTSRNGLQADVSYSFPLKDDKRLSFGMAASLMQYRIDKSSFARYIPNDPLLASDGTEIKGDAAVGIYYSSSTWNGGISMQQITQTELNFVKTSTNPEGKLYRHYYVMLNNRIKTDEDNVVIPNILVKYLPNSPVDVEAGARIEHKDLFWFGFNFHYKQNYTALAGVKLNHKLAIGYAYSVYKTPLSLYDNGGGAHEMSFKYFFKK